MCHTQMFTYYRMQKEIVLMANYYLLNNWNNIVATLLTFIMESKAVDILSRAASTFASSILGFIVTKRPFQGMKRP